MKESLIAGLISGLIVTFLVLIVRNFWKAIIIPWFEERVYKDVRIEGKWFGLYPETIDQRGDVIILKRHGHTITGTMTCINGSTNDTGVEYSLNGSFRNMILPLIYEAKDNNKTDRGTITLRCIKNGDVLSGKIALYNSIYDEISSGEIIWYKSKKDYDEAIKKLTQPKKEKTIVHKIEPQKPSVKKANKVAKKALNKT